MGRIKMLCSNGVKLRLDFAVADQRYGNHKQRRANDPQPEEATSPIHSLLLSPFAATRAARRVAAEVDR